MMKFLLLILIVLPQLVHGSPFQAVFVTDEDAVKLGGYPLARRRYAEALYAAKRAGAEAVILKFFFDAPGKSPKDDVALAEAIKNCGLKVVLQARLDETEKKSNPLAAKFIRSDLPRLDGAFNGNSGWLPLPVLAEGAYAVAFIDGLNPVPVVEMYRGHPMPSLFLVALELALGKAAWTPTTMTLSGVTLPMRGGEIEMPHPAKDVFRPFSLSALLDGKTENALKGAIVVIGYDGREMHKFPTPIGDVKAHRLFFYELELAYTAFSKRN